jgi:hypothetical protein
MRSRRWFDGVFAATTAIAAGILAGCSVLGGGSAIRSQSVVSADALEFTPTERAYVAADKNTADIYLTDLPASALAPEADVSEVSGQVLHLHLFIAPEAGSTPIASTACSVTVRHVVVSRGEIGVYGGGGFLLPSSTPGDDEFEGRVLDATLKLISATTGFSDRLGPTELSGYIEAPKDAAGSARLAATLDSLLTRAAKQSRR